MYIPGSFLVEDEKVIHGIVEANSFATLVSRQKEGLIASHISLLIDEDNQFLYGHLARVNNHCESLEGEEVLAIFQGSHCYVSPSWYETSRAVPTWNYVAVHVYGQIELLDEEALLSSLYRMVLKYEGEESTYKLDGIDPKYIRSLMKGIVGFRIRISRIEAKAKLSQNHSIERQQLIINHLEEIQEDGSKNIAALMKESLRKSAIETA